MSVDDVRPNYDNDDADNPEVVVSSPKSGFRVWLTRLGGGALAVSLFVHLGFLLLAIFVFIRWVEPPVTPPPDFSGSAGGGGGSGGPKIQAAATSHHISTARQPSRAIVSSAMATFSLPDTPSSLLGAAFPDPTAGAGSGGGTGGGAGTGDGTGIGSGQGPGTGTATGLGAGGKVTFFNQSTRAKRVAYVIDYSLSMTGRRIKLLRDELTRSVGSLDMEKEYQLIFFAGPAWMAGDKVEMGESRKEAVVKSGRDEFRWAVAKDRPVWEVKGRPRNIRWLRADPDRVARSLEAIASTPLEYGTSWEAPLELALRLEPVPDLIFFMTDGVSGKESMKIAERLGHRAKARKAVINTIAMMQPDAVGPMKELARRSGGKFSVIESNGQVSEQPLD